MNRLSERRIHFAGLGSVTVLQMVGCAMFVILMLSIVWIMALAYQAGVIGR